MPIAPAKTGRGFGGLARYLMAGSDGKHPERVDWVDSRNLLSTDANEAALVMTHTAARNGRVEKPVYHVSINWHPEDEPTPEQMEATADRLLLDLGLSEHQVLMVAHRDTEHRHVHLMVNRVHPETTRAWRNDYDRFRIRESLGPIEREMGWRPVAGSNRQFVHAAEHDAYRIKKLAWEPMHTSRSWPELEDRLHKVGLTLKARGPGLVITDGRRYIKASEVDRSLSRQGLEERFGQKYRDWRGDVGKVQRHAKHHHRLTARALRGANPRNLQGQVARVQHRAHQARSLMEGSGDARMLEAKMAAFAVRYGLVALRRASPGAAAILEAIRLAKRTLDRGRSR
jgi:hypothetical protein